MRTRLGQNFLVDEEWQRKIVEHFQPPGEFAEIGPGRGELTEHLRKRGQKFVVFEKDSKLAAFHRMFKDYQVVEGDFLDWNFSLQGMPVQDFSFIGNLPYESGTAIVKRLAEKSDQVRHFVFMLQREVVDRIAAQPRSRDFGFLTVVVQGQFDIQPLDVVPPEVFDPPPKVYSQLLRGDIRPREKRHPLEPIYLKFLSAAFLNKRKTLRNVLKGRIPLDLLDELMKDFGWPATVRAEEIAVDLWPEFHRRVTIGRSERAQRESSR